jgi:hypothetical protein
MNKLLISLRVTQMMHCNAANGHIESIAGCQSRGNEEKQAGNRDLVWDY